MGNIIWEKSEYLVLKNHDFSYTNSIKWESIEELSNEKLKIFNELSYVVYNNEIFRSILYKDDEYIYFQNYEYILKLSITKHRIEFSN